MLILPKENEQGHVSDISWALADDSFHQINVLNLSKRSITRRRPITELFWKLCDLIFANKIYFLTGSWYDS